MHMLLALADTVGMVVPPVEDGAVGEVEVVEDWDDELVPAILPAAAVHPTPTGVSFDIDVTVRRAEWTRLRPLARSKLCVLNDGVSDDDDAKNSTRFPTYT